MERIDDTGFGNVKVIQETEGFCYGVDAVLLADFTNAFCRDFKLLVDLGTGNGIIPLILSHKNKNAEFIGLEIQSQAIELAKRSCALNGLEGRMFFLEGDVSSSGEMLETAVGSREVDVVTCNPPYFKNSGKMLPDDDRKVVARHETTAGMEEFIKAASQLLKTGGHYFMVHRPSRLVDALYHCREEGLEPKDMRLVVPRAGENPNIVLIHCVAGGGRQLNVMNELRIYDADGAYSDEILRIYERR